MPSRKIYSGHERQGKTKLCHETQWMLELSIDDQHANTADANNNRSTNVEKFYKINESAKD